MNLTGQLADQQHEFSSLKAVYQVDMMSANSANSVTSVRAELCVVELFNMGVTRACWGILGLQEE